MLSSEESSFTQYDHGLIHGDTPHMLRNALRMMIGISDCGVMDQTPARTLDSLKCQIQCINSENIWYFALSKIGMSNSDIVIEIANKNARQMHELSFILSAGIVYGHDSLVASLGTAQKEMTPTKELGVSAVRDFDTLYEDLYELVSRTQHVMGNIEQEGTIHKELQILEQPVFFRQPLLEDMFRIYGSYIESELTARTDSI